MKRILSSTALCFAVACGGGDASSPPPQAGPAPSAKPVEEKPKEVAAPVDAAQTRLAELTKQIDSLAGDDAIDPDWLAGVMREIQKAKPTDPTARFNLAVLAERKGKTDETRQAYLDIVGDNPDFTPALENLAAYHAESGDAAKAMQIYNGIVEKDPKNVTSRLAMARLLHRENKHNEAIELCRRALQVKADAIEAFRVLAKSYKAVGNVPMAELIIGKGLQVSKNDVELHSLMADILLDRNDIEGGVGKLKELIRMDPDRLSARARLAEIALSYRDFGNAAQQYEAILKKDPANRPTQIGLGVSYKGLGRFDQAEAIYKKLLTQDSEDLDALWNLAVLYHRHLNKYDEAVATYNSFKKEAPSNDPQAAKVEELVAEVLKVKNDRAAEAERLAREQKKLESIQAACVKLAAGTPAPKEAEAIGNESERMEVAWQLMVEAQTALQAGDMATGEGNVKCAFGILPDTPGARTSACAPMKVMWTQLLYQMGRMDEALKQIDDAIKCDDQNPDAQLIKQQLQEIIKQQQEAAAQQPPADPAAAPGAQPAPAGGGGK
jgi:tetratricopeptide (TPR) repeat protein